jgi:hypothetical protein
MPGLFQNDKMAKYEGFAGGYDFMSGTTSVALKNASG